jgi:hypothetical protein
LILLLIVSNNHRISANNIYDSPQSLTADDDQSKYLFERNNFYDSIDNEIPSSDLWSRIFRRNYMTKIPNYDLRHGVIRFVPYKKRTIPLELQKALYAHGIVGRRR